MASFLLKSWWFQHKNKEPGKEGVYHKQNKNTLRQQVNTPTFKWFKSWITTVKINTITTKSGIKLRPLCKYSKMDWTELWLYQLLFLSIAPQLPGYTATVSVGLFLKGAKNTYKLLKNHDSSPLQNPVDFDEIGNTLHLEKALCSWQVKAPGFRSGQYKPSGTELQWTGKFAAFFFSESVINY